MSTVKELVLHHLTYTFEKEAWQPPLSIAVAGLTAAQAAWKPGPERHSIWQIVRHLIRWKESVLAAMEGEPRSFRELTRGDWQEAGGDEAAWKADLSRLREVSLRLKSHAEALDDQSLGRPISSYAGTPPRPIDRRLLDMATHDEYHAGQIQYIRALQEIPADQWFQAAFEGRTDKLRHLLDGHPELLNANSRDGWTALMLAAWVGERDAVEFLLDRGADVHAVSANDLQETALRSAEQGKHDAVAALLRARGATR